LQHLVAGTYQLEAANFYNGIGLLTFTNDADDALSTDKNFGAQRNNHRTALTDDRMTTAAQKTIAIHLQITAAGIGLVAGGILNGQQAIVTDGDIQIAAG